jgi:hypothetical protein
MPSAFSELRMVPDPDCCSAFITSKSVLLLMLLLLLQLGPPGGFFPDDEDQAELDVHDYLVERVARLNPYWRWEFGEKMQPWLARLSVLIIGPGLGDDPYVSAGGRFTLVCGGCCVLH